MKIEILSAKNPVWGNAEKTQINLQVQFQHLEDWVPFSATAADPAEHGRELFVRALHKAYGPIAEISAEELQAELLAHNLQIQKSQMRVCVEKVQYWDMFNQPEKAQAWRIYYQQLAQLPETTETWPVVETWPTAPAE